MEELKVKINTGAVKVKLTDENDIEIGYFSFVPTDMGIIKKSGSFYSYNDSKLGQGRDAVKNVLRDNPDLADEIEARIMEALKK